MSGKEQRLPDYLEHTIEAIDRIESYIGDMDKAAFCENTLVIDAVIRNIEVIGEASNRCISTIASSLTRTRKCRGEAVTKCGVWWRTTISRSIST